MNSLLENDDEFARGDRELTLSTAAILGIFLGIVLLCGLFFGFGYKMGSHKSAPPVDADSSTTTSTPTADFNAFKPAAGSPAGSSTAKTPAIAPSTPDRASSATASSPARANETSAATLSLPEAAGGPTPRISPAAPAGANSAPAATGSFVVQVAAVTLQEDADLLAGALRSKGYAVTARAQPDKLIHIQVGPFATRREADAMRQRLLGDGYNAIVK